MSLAHLAQEQKLIAGRLHRWAADYLPQAQGPLRDEPELHATRWQSALQRAGEWLLGGRLGDRLERWERNRKLRKFAPVAGQAGSAAELDADRVKGHFDDHGHPILQKFNERMQQTLAGDEQPAGVSSSVALSEEAAD